MLIHLSQQLQPEAEDIRKYDIAGCLCEFLSYYLKRVEAVMHFLMCTSKSFRTLAREQLEHMRFSIYELLV